MKTSQITQRILLVCFSVLPFLNKSRRYRQVYITFFICFFYLVFFALICACRSEEVQLPSGTADSVVRPSLPSPILLPAFALDRSPSLTSGVASPASVPMLAANGPAPAKSHSAPPTAAPAAAPTAASNPPSTAAPTAAPAAVPTAASTAAPTAASNPASTAAPAPTSQSTGKVAGDKAKAAESSSGQGIAHSGSAPVATSGQNGLGIDDINQFQSKTSTVGESSEQLKAKAKAKESAPSSSDESHRRLEEQASASLEDYCENTETALAACFDSFAPYFRLFESYSPMVQWTGHLKELYQNIF
ncbi:MAG: hypothetical protein PHQ75_01775, partial [Thermoguttaceae bacterium]|nr:hypothetical protein [Thermoguttaceae bacterium]